MSKRKFDEIDDCNNIDDDDDEITSSGIESVNDVQVQTDEWISSCIEEPTDECCEVIVSAQDNECGNEVDVVTGGLELDEDDEDDDDDDEEDDEYAENEVS